MNNKRNNAKHTIQILSFLELGARRSCLASSCRAAPGSPGLALAADGNWTQEFTDQDLDQGRRQDNDQGPLQQAAMDEESKTLVIPQL